VAQVGNNYIGTYRRLKMMRQGKTCQIWETIRASDNQRCVLKILRDDVRQDKNEIAMLKHEYVIGSALDHENCIDVFGFDIARGIPYLAIEYFESLNLKQWIRDPAAKREWLPTIIEQSASGIGHLHSKGWIHLDLKPDNLLVNDKSEVRLIDFAIGQRLKKGFGRLLGGRGKVAGTRSYMSPEQIRNQPLDVRTDLYSFGCLVFEIVSGKLPYTGTSSDDLLQRHLKSPVPSLTAFSDDVNPVLGRLVERLMSKKRDDRPNSMLEFLHDFKKIRLPFGRPN
jgi:serine/threonine-protein kinase